MTRKRVFITGATDGLGLGLALRLASEGCVLALHGRDPAKLQAVVERVQSISGSGEVEGFTAHLERGEEVRALGGAVRARFSALDAVVHNAGVFRVEPARAAEGIDLRIAVNVLAPLAVTDALLPCLGRDSRVVAVTSSAQARVDVATLQTGDYVTDMDAYAQSKLALIHWARDLERSQVQRGIEVVAVNPGSLLATKMVREGFGLQGSRIDKGVCVLARLALAPRTGPARSLYFDNDVGRFERPHPDALDDARNATVVAALRALAARLGYLDPASPRRY